jgi:soluble lytic murein transglycosylase-like protein
VTESHSRAWFLLRTFAVPGLALALAACTAGESASPLAPGLLPELSVASIETAPLEPQPAAEPPPNRWLEPPVAAEDPAGLTQQLLLAERSVRDAGVNGAELAWMAHLQQVVYRRLVEQPQLRDTVLTALPPELRLAARMNVDAGADLRAMVTPGEKLPSWRIIEPPTADELLGHYRAAEAEFGVPWNYLAAIHLVETVMGRIRGTSVAGAQGPMQFMPATWASYGEGDINDPRDAIRAAARYLRASGAPGNMANAVFRYNPSQRYVRAVSGYAEVMRIVPESYRAYYHWQVYYLTRAGDTLLPVGYGPETSRAN